MLRYKVQKHPAFLHALRGWAARLDLGMGGLLYIILDLSVPGEGPSHG